MANRIQSYENSISSSSSSSSQAMIQNIQEPFTLLQIYNTNDKFKEYLERLKPYSLAEFNCANLSLVLLGLIKDDDIIPYMEICNARNRLTDEEEFISDLRSAFAKVNYEIPKVSSINPISIKYDIKGDPKAFQTHILDISLQYLKGGYSTPLIIRNKDGTMHMVVLRKEEIIPHTYLFEAQVKPGQPYPLVMNAIDINDYNLSYISGIDSIYFLKGPEINMYEIMTSKIAPSQYLMRESGLGGGKRKRRNKTKKQKRKQRKTKRKGSGC